MAIYGRQSQDRDTAWAVDARVLSLEPLGLALQEEDLPKREAPTPAGREEAAANVAPAPGLALHNAPEPLKEWVGRADLLRAAGPGLDRPQAAADGPHRLRRGGQKQPGPALAGEPASQPGSAPAPGGVLVGVLREAQRRGVSGRGPGLFQRRASWTPGIIHPL